MIQALAPMDWITDSAYRLVVQEIFEKYNLNDELRTRTEFMSADGYCVNPPKLVRHLLIRDDEKKVIAQIYGGKQDELVRTAIDIQTKYGDRFAGIELNIGCPSPKVMACGGWSGMMKEKDKTVATIKAISESIDLPFSIKTRIGLTPDDRPAQKEFLMAAAPYCQAISIHGRTYKQGHSGDVDRDFIYDIKTSLGESCLVIGNGGITSYEDGLQKRWNLDGVMTAQSAIANPWLFTPHTPTIQDRYETTLRHLDLLCAMEIHFQDHQFSGHDENYYANTEHTPEYRLEMPNRLEQEASLTTIDPSRIRFAPIEFRKFLFNYVKGIPNAKEFKVAVAQERDLATVKTLIHEFFQKSLANEQTL